MRLFVGLMAGALVGAVVPASAAPRLVGPVAADVVRVIDGDTIEIAAEVWIGVTIAASVRIRGIDTPEMRGACPEEKALAAAARDLLAEIAGGTVRLTNIEHDKYAGRVLADVAAEDGTDLGGRMTALGYARAYDGGARADWCPTASVDG